MERKIFDTWRNGQPPKSQPKQQNDQNALVDVFNESTFLACMILNPRIKYSSQR
jgi:hypothetical protein